MARLSLTIAARTDRPGGGEYRDVHRPGVQRIINDVIYAELSVRYDAKEDLDTFINEAGLKREPVPSSALFLAGKVFRKYRKSGGVRTGVLPDFFIGAHAAVLELPLLTRDTGRYRTYFPTVDLFAPEAKKPT